MKLQRFVFGLWRNCYNLTYQNSPVKQLLYCLVSLKKVRKILLGSSEAGSFSTMPSLVEQMFDGVPSLRELVGVSPDHQYEMWYSWTQGDGRKIVKEVDYKKDDWLWE